MAAAVFGQQKALAVTSKGGPFTLIRREISTPGPGDVLVKLEGVGLNPVEWMLQTGFLDFSSLIGADFPAFYGVDGAGTVVEIGEAVMKFKKGDRVLFQGWLDANGSSFQEYALIDATLTARISDSMSAVQAAAMPLCLTTAALGLTQEFPAIVSNRGGAGLKPFWEEGAQGYYSGKPIVVLGGASIVGQFVIQIAHYMGFSPIIVTSSLQHTAYLESMGATNVVDRYVETGPAIARLKRDLGIEIELVYDAAHTPVTQAQVDLLSPNGTLVSGWVVPEELKLTDGRRVTATYGTVHLDKERGRRMYARMEYLLEQGIIKPVRVEKLSGGLAGIAEGLGRLQRNEVRGTKLVVDPTETPKL
ncbi:chaperonin 10-like protein [Mycena latifolia]|nr:chaperonin 10-like protein [Mycena latifolia]